MLGDFLATVSDGDAIAPRQLAARLSLPMTGLARLAHVNRNLLASRPGSPSVQARLGEIARIIARAAELTEDAGKAVIWFKHQPIAGFGGRTAEQLVGEGQGQAVMDYLRGVDEGVYA